MNTNLILRATGRLKKGKPDHWLLAGCKRLRNRVWFGYDYERYEVPEVRFYLIAAIRAAAGWHLVEDCEEWEFSRGLD